MKFVNVLCSVSILIILVCFSIGCKKIEGEGGSSTIIGKVYVEDYDAFGELIAEYYEADEDVFIIYGEESNIYNDDFSTSHDGSYRFEYLTKGTYQIFAYQKCAECPSGEEPVIKTVEIKDNNSTVVVPDLVIRK